MVDLAEHPSLQRVTSALLEAWPEHEPFVERSFAGRSARSLACSSEVARLVLLLAGDAGGLRQFADDYRFMCERMIFPEEVYFQRNRRYRLSTFDEANREVYQNAPLMTRYVNGILFSQVFWANHASALEHYAEEFLPEAPPGDHLEVGPGHGLFLALAAARGRAASLTAWDVSDTSLAATRRSLSALGVKDAVRLVAQDVLSAPVEEQAFDSIVVGELLEHLEAPLLVLERLRSCLRPGGLIWVNMPVNSPAPDHIFLVRTPEEVVELVERAGLRVEACRRFPATGVTEERARAKALTISTVVVARRPAG